MGCEPDQHRAHGDGGLAADQGRGLVARSAATASCQPWPSRLWPMDKHYQSHRRAGRLRHRLRRCRRRSAPRSRTATQGRFSVNFQPDGDLMFAAGRPVDRGAPQDSAADGDAQQPRLSSGDDARAAHGEPAQPRRIARQDIGRSARASTTRRSTTPSWPVPSACGRRGPITDPKDLAPALNKAVEVVKSGEPAMVDVVTQPR